MEIINRVKAFIYIYISDFVFILLNDRIRT